MNRISGRFLCALAFALLCIGPLAAADIIELENGDRISGKVLAIDGQSVQLQSDALGKLTVERSKIESIHFGRAKTTAAGKPTQANKQGKAKEPTEFEKELLKQLRARGLNIRSLDDLGDRVGKIRLPKDSKPGQTPQDVVRQLQQNGLDDATLSQVQSQIPLLVVPGVRGYFDKTVNGLISGKIDLNDVRRDAIKARAGLVNIQKDLGDSGQALNGYLMILDGFLEQTDPNRSKEPRRTKPPAVKPPAIPQQPQVPR